MQKQLDEWSETYEILEITHSNNCKLNNNINEVPKKFKGGATLSNGNHAHIGDIYTPIKSQTLASYNAITLCNVNSMFKNFLTMSSWEITGFCI